MPAGTPTTLPIRPGHGRMKTPSGPPREVTLYAVFEKDDKPILRAVAGKRCGNEVRLNMADEAFGYRKRIPLADASFTPKLAVRQYAYNLYRDASAYRGAASRCEKLALQAEQTLLLETTKEL